MGFGYVERPGKSVNGAKSQHWEIVTGQNGLYLVFMDTVGSWVGGTGEIRNRMVTNY